jgi:trigger factor
VPGWANAVAGLSIGDQKEIEDQISPEYRDPNLAGKIATYNVTVKSIKQRELPDVDDELARSVGDYEDLTALRADLRKRLQAQKKNSAREEYETELVDKLIEISEIDYPAVMVDQEVDQMLREADNNFRRQGFTLDMFLRGTNKSLDEMRAEWEPRAVHRLKTALVLRELISAEKLELESGKLDTELNRMVEDQPADRRVEVRRLVGTERVRDSVEQELLLRKALDLLDVTAGGEQFVEAETEGVA